MSWICRWGTRVSRWRHEVQRHPPFYFICAGKRVNSPHLVDGSLSKELEYQRPVEMSLFWESPSFSLSACCCRNNSVWHEQSATRLCQFQVALCWFHQLNQVQLWLRLTGHVWNADVCHKAALFQPSLINPAKKRIFPGAFVIALISPIQPSALTPRSHEGNKHNPTHPHCCECKALASANFGIWVYLWTY